MNIAGARFEGPLAPSADAELTLGLIPAMRSGEALTISEPVSPRLLASVPEIQGCISTWWGEYSQVPVHASPGEPGQPAAGVAAFFSGGVDSFYTALRHPEITHLVFAHGFDIPLSNTALRESASLAARTAADELGKPLIELETDVKRLGLNWEHLHGAALAATGHLLAETAGTVLIPASHTYSDLGLPVGSHPVLDPLWSSERVRFVHDGTFATRFEKTAFIAQHPVALEHLRVCWRSGEYNCGRCEKCVRTMTALRVAGSLRDCRTLPDELDLRLVRRLWPDKENVAAFLRENRDAALTRDPELARALNGALRLAAVRAPLRRARARLSRAL